MPQPAQRASIDAPYLRMLRRAVQIAGGEAELVAAWNIPPEKLRSWLAGERVLPVDFYVLAIDIVEGATRQT